MISQECTRTHARTQARTHMYYGIPTHPAWSKTQRFISFVASAALTERCVFLTNSSCRRLLCRRRRRRRSGSGFFMRVCVRVVLTNVCVCASVRDRKIYVLAHRKCAACEANRNRFVSPVLLERQWRASAPYTVHTTHTQHSLHPDAVNIYSSKSQVPRRTKVCVDYISHTQVRSIDDTKLISYICHQIAQRRRRIPTTTASTFPAGSWLRSRRLLLCMRARVLCIRRNGGSERRNKIYVRIRISLTGRRCDTTRYTTQHPKICVRRCVFI